ncbi:MAG TPA: dihydroorotate dehydrogenase electron transfer subunit [Bacteroidales bacterium]|jgi:dihydroorotate dehydrogenase electron transfer subunit|nr:MAG: Dihydroorotate dehydrogenase B (NAD(+)), electron transfer subunit [Bacteroidetes bacterium ADurb.Bin012]HNQ59674.1 dihydroorotate dehydrogenase electron transfer subunit [Bacteroidales bacterium]HNU21215.1 dihydroorotate dehydrogenase electron transfer subunit [Bacteroidales bacterium]HNV16548.1 dihydroorotate dehydrogenase electron transfer subunit [Bacteroidales bacterium]HNZ78689.1 dihydroorotate dehydrogenase electron transfer subunit [Bacteroidales bacterium]
MPGKFIHDFIVLRNISLNASHFILELLCPIQLPEIFPGQFVEVKVEHSPATFLRRPFSIHEVDRQENYLQLLIQIKGDGTRQLSLLEPGESLNMIYPLGNSFHMVKHEKVLLVGGGCGVAPLLFLARILKENENELYILIGAKTKEDILEKKKFEKFGKVFITTEDGSEGRLGLVIHHGLWRQTPFMADKIYTCGPEPMMKEVARLALIHGINCEVSLEQTMACGLGACLCCVVKTKDGHTCTCTQGPVFDSKELSGWVN